MVLKKPKRAQAKKTFNNLIATNGEYNRSWGDLKRLPVHRPKTTIVSEITELAHAPNFGYTVL
jgi:hypothetical protein